MRLKTELKNLTLKNFERGLKDMPEFDFTGNFLNENNAKDGDICVITSCPYPEEKENPLQKQINQDGVMVNKKYWVLNIPIEINQKSKIYTPDNATGLRFSNEWGSDYSKWIGKKFRVKLESYTAFGRQKTRISGFPIIEK